MSSDPVRPGLAERFRSASPRMKAFAIFKVVPGAVGIPLVIVGAATGHDVLLVVGFVFLGVYVTEMAVVTPVLLARGSLREPTDDEPKD